MRIPFVVLLVVGCTDAVTAPGAGDGVLTIPGDEVGEGEGEGGPADEGEDGSPDEPGPPDEPSPPGEEGEGEGAAPDPRGGSFGSDCDDHADCASGFCLQTVRGRMCSVQCTEECPRDWDCRIVATGGADASSLCFPPDPILCEPCELDGDCGELGDRCVQVGRGAYCGVACSDDSPCPGGFACTDLEDAGGGVFDRQCIPETGSCSPCEDSDGDGFGDGGDCLGVDCDDGREGVHPGAVEVCNRRDDDCDLEVDEGFDLSSDMDHCGACGRACAPMSGSGACEGGACVITACDRGFHDIDGDVENGCEYGCDVESAERCDATVVREGDEVVVLDGADQDCDGEPEDGFRPDAAGRSLGDACGLGPCAGGFWECTGDGEGLRCSTLLGGSEQVALEAEECNGIDDTCSGVLRRIEQDRDGDGWLECVNGPPGGQWGDCDDDDWEVFPGARERCDHKDNNCDGVPDRVEFDFDSNPVHCGGCATEETPEFNCRIFFQARDGNVQRPGCAAGRCVVDTCREGFHDVNGSPHDGCEYACELTNDGVEICDGLDNDCDGRIDVQDPQLTLEPCELVDGVCAGLLRPLELCVDGGWLPCERAHYAAWSEDYEDGVELRCDDLDNDCDGEVNEGLSADDDGDGHYLLGSCDQPADDCDDGDPERHGGFAEICDGKDNDCDQRIDQGLSTDADGDGHFVPGSCADPADDCDDRNPLRFPGNPETCDGHDNDCNGSVDPAGSQGCQNFWQDADNDGWGVGGAQCLCGPADPVDAAQPGDCFDGNPNARPGQGGWFVEPRGAGGLGFDYNCDGVEQRRWEQSAGSCRFFGDFCDGGAGYDGGAPGCGGSRPWKEDCYYSTSGWPWDWGCYWRHSNNRRQSCR